MQAMLQKTMLEKLIRNKLQQKLNSFFKLQKSTIEGLSIRNLQMKPDILKQLSQLIKVPLVLISGSIDSVSLNIPWENIFYTRKDEGIALVVSGVKISAKLPNNFSKQYINGRKKKIIQKFTQEFNKKSTSRLTFINKLKQYFFGTFSVQFRDIKLQVHIELKHSLIGVLSVQHLKFQKNNTNDNSKFQVRNLSLGYKFIKQHREQHIVSRADLLMSGQKKQGINIDNFETNNIEISFSNQNFNDIRRLITLIKWHNSFINIPEQLWLFKPSIMGTVKPRQKLMYVCNMILYKIRERRPQQLKQSLIKRKEYIRVFEEFRRDPSNLKLKQHIYELQGKLQTWKIKQFRRFCLLWEKKYPDTPHQIIKKLNIIKKQNAQKKVSWLSFWFPKNEQNQIKQLQECLNRAPVNLNKKQITFNIQNIKIALVITSHMGRQAFLNLFAINNSIQILKTPIVSQEHGITSSQVIYQSQKKFKIQKFMIQFDKYCGHHQDHRYMLQQNVNNVLKQSFDQFEDIQNFFQCSISHNKTLMNIMPFNLKINEQIMQRFYIFRFQKIHSTFNYAQKLIFEQNKIQSQKVDEQNCLILRTSFNMIIPQNMCLKQSQNLQLFFTDIQYLNQNKKISLKVKQILFLAHLLLQNEDEKAKFDQSSRKMQQSISSLRNQANNVQLETVQFFRTSLDLGKQISNSLQQIKIMINPIKIKFMSINSLKFLIRLLTKLKPKQNKIKQLNKKKYFRRKQSIGQQFIDAYQNLQQHMIKSKSITDNTKKNTYIVNQRKDKKYYIQIEKIKITLQQSQLQLTKTIAIVYQFQDYKAFSIDSQKSLNIEVYNIRNFLKNINQLQNQFTRMFELKKRSLSTEEKKSQTDQQGDALTLNNFTISFCIYHNKKPKIKAEISNLQVQLYRNKNVRVEFTSSLAFNQYTKNAKNPKQEKVVKQYFIESFRLKYLHEKVYNKDQKLIKLGDLIINIKPKLLVQFGNIFDMLNTPEKTLIEVVNNTVNYISIFGSGRSFKQYEFGQKAICQQQNCNIIIFGQKQKIALSRQSKLQKIKLTQNINLLKIMKTQYLFHIESNIRVTNKQRNTIWVRIVSNKINQKYLNKNKYYKAPTVSFEDLKSAYIGKTPEKTTKNIKSDRNTNFKRSNSVNNKMIQQDEHDISFERQLEDTIIGSKKVPIIRTLGNANINPNLNQQRKITYNPIIGFQKKVSSQKSVDSYNSSNDKQFSNPHTVITKYKGNARNVQNSYEILFQPIEPNRTVQLLVNSENYYIQFIEFSSNGGDILEKYEPVRIRRLLENSSQVLVHSLVDQDQRSEVASTLVISTNVLAHLTHKDCNIYQIQLLSPIVISNKIPMDLHFSFGKEQLDVLEVIKSAGKQLPKQSLKFQLQKLEPFNIRRINRMLYKQITQTQIHVKDCKKNFRFDKIIEGIKSKQQEIDIRIVDFLCLDNGENSMQLGIQIKIFKNVMKMTIFSQFIFINMTSLNLNLEFSEQNYTYPPLKIEPIQENKSQNYKQFIKMSNSKISQQKMLQQLFKQNQSNINTFTGSFQQEIVRSVKHGPNGQFISSRLYNNYQLIQKNKNRNKIINYDNKTKLLIRKIPIDDKPVNLIFFIPSLYIINKSDWSFHVKSQGEKLKKLSKNSTQYLLINDSISIQACEEKEDIAYNQWMKISLNTLGIIFYAKQMTSSSGYESRQYELRKKRLKKVPKLFFKILLTRYNRGYQILIQESQYPPVSFINRCKQRVQIRQTTQNVFQQMQNNQTAEYASKIPHHTGKFTVSMVENYQFRKFGQFSLKESQFETVLNNRIKVKVEQYKDKKIVVFQDFNQQKDIKSQSIIKHQFMLQKLSRVILSMSKIQISIMTSNNKQLSCACINDVQLIHETKNTKRYVKFNINNFQIFGYNGMQPRYLFYFNKPNNMSKVISKNEVIGYFKEKFNQGQPSGVNLMKSNISSRVLNTSKVSSQIHQAQQSLVDTSSVFSLDLIIDYHKHATILERCKGNIMQIVIVINANTIIDYIKHYYKDLKEVVRIINRHQVGRNFISEIKGIFSGESQSDNAEMEKTGNLNESTSVQNSKMYRQISRKQSVSINNINQNYNYNTNLNKKNSINSNLNSPLKMQKNISQNYNQSLKSNRSDQVDIFNRDFLIQSFLWNGVKVTFKFENIQNFQYFLNRKQIKQKYFIKFITWIGDLRPIQFSPTQVQYQQYTIMKMIELIDVNKLIIGIYQTFLQYPLQELYHVISFTTKFLGFNDFQQNDQQWNTLKRLGRSVLKMAKMVFMSNTKSPIYQVTQNGELRQNKNYVERFIQERPDNQTIIQRINNFKYQQWRYKQQANHHKLNLKNSRLQRYNLCDQVLQYDANKAKIQTAINDHFGNKLYREIKIIKEINKDVIMGATEDCFVLYMVEKGEWVTARPEHVGDIRIAKTKAKKVSGIGFSFNKTNPSQKKLQITIINDKQKNGKQFRIDKYLFTDLKITASEIEFFNEYIQSLKLTNIY